MIGLKELINSVESRVRLDAHEQSARGKIGQLARSRRVLVCGIQNRNPSQFEVCIH